MISKTDQRFSDEQNEPLTKTVVFLNDCRSDTFIFRPRNVGRKGDFDAGLDIFVLKRFLESEECLVTINGVILDSVRSRGRNDPPDCEGIDVTGNKYGFELTELIDEGYIRNMKSQNGRIDPKKYSEEHLIATLQECLNKKARSFQDIRGKPYHKLILVIITNALLLNFDFCREVLKSHQFIKASPWDLAFLCLPPSVPHAPVQNVESMNYKVLPIEFST